MVSTRLKLKQEKLLHIVIRNTAVTIDCEEIKGEGHTCQKSVKKVPIFFDKKKVQSSSGNLKVRFEKPRKIKETHKFQWCQRFNHTQHTGKNEARCLKCSCIHMTYQCIKKKEIGFAKCVDLVVYIW